MKAEAAGVTKASSVAFQSLLCSSHVHFSVPVFVCVFMCAAAAPLGMCLCETLKPVTLRKEGERGVTAVQTRTEDRTQSKGQRGKQNEDNEEEMEQEN